MSKDKEFSLLRYERYGNSDHVWVETVIEDYAWLRKLTRYSPNIIKLPEGGLMSGCGLQLIDDIDKAYRFREDNEEDRVIKKHLLRNERLEEILSTTKMGDIEREEE